MGTTRQATATQKRVCDLVPLNVRAEPFSHVVREDFIEPELYRQLRRTFPVCQPGKSPTGFSLYWGDEGYGQLLDEQPAWRALFETFHSQSFIEWAGAQFAEVWHRDGCRIDPAGGRYVSYREDRIDKERAALRRVEHGPEQLWVRMDIHQGRVGYFRPVHLDHARRLVSMLIYFCDHEESEMVGGELFLHGRDAASRETVRIAPRHNLMVAFPCTNGSQHSVSKITSTAALRHYVQVHISSSIDLWPREPAPPLWRRSLSSLSRRLVEVARS
jgi:hypothetical protein